MKMKKWIRATAVAGILAIMVAVPASAELAVESMPDHGYNYSGWCRTC